MIFTALSVLRKTYTPCMGIGYFCGRPIKGTMGVGEIIFLVLKVVGALAFFLFGMKVMSDGIQKVAGSRLRDILGAMTNNRLSGVLTGFVTTCLIQSSSATTVMIVSFVNAGLLKLKQAIGVIMGANIGTTMTAWLFVLGVGKFSLSTYSLPIMALAFPMLFVKSSRYRSLGEFLMGFGLLFLGLSALKNVVADLHLGQNQDFILWVNDLASSGIGGILFFVLIGTLLTVIVQSSSAAMALTLVFLGSGLPFNLAAAIVLGENIGTTITANLAALIGNVHAKRAARAHFIFNIFGVLWMIFVFSLFLNGVGYALEKYFGLMNPTAPLAEGATEAVKEEYATAVKTAAETGLALFHTCFNIINTLLLIWFVDFIAKLVTRMVKSKGGDDEFTLEYIGRGLHETPELSLFQAQKEAARFGELATKMNRMVRLQLEISDKRELSKSIDKITLYEQMTDRMEVEIAKYLTKLSNAELTEDTSNRVRSLLSIANDLERIGDVYFQVSKTIQVKGEKRVYFVPKQREHLKEMFDALGAALDQMNANLSQTKPGVDIEAARQLEVAVNDLYSKLRKKHLKDIEKAKYSIESGMYYMETLGLLETAGDQILAISEALDGEI